VGLLTSLVAFIGKYYMLNKWKSIEVEMWNNCWIKAENLASNAIVIHYRHNIEKEPWVLLWSSFYTPLDSGLQSIFRAIGRASFGK
jgi:hypothetical protein